MPRIAIQFINDSPRVEEDSVEIDFVLSRPTTSVTCQLNKREQFNCKYSHDISSCTFKFDSLCIAGSSGRVNLTNLDPGKYSLRVEAGKNRDERGIERRFFEIPADANYCTTHLINEGISVGSSGEVSVEFASLGPATSFLCRLDVQGQPFACKYYIIHDTVKISMIRRSIFILTSQPSVTFTQYHWLQVNLQFNSLWKKEITH